MYYLQAAKIQVIQHRPQYNEHTIITVKPEIFTTFSFSRLSRIRKIREIKKPEKFYLFSYL